MNDVSFLSRVRRHAANFRSAKGGNVAVIFAFSLVPMLLAVGAAVDYTRANTARTAMQAALDSTALMLSKDVTGLSASEASEKGQKYFNALYNHPEAKNITITTNYSYTPTAGYKIVVDGSGSIPTDFLQMAGYPSLSFGSSSTVVWGNTRLRVAMALDVTGSMLDDGKLAAMKKAAISLVNTLKSTAKMTGDVYMSVIPFNRMVNVGMASKDADKVTWLDWDTDYGSCSQPSLLTKSSCILARKTWTPKNVNKWTGCVYDRDKDPSVNYDTTNDPPDNNTLGILKKPGTLFMAQNYTSCSSSLLPMMSLYDSKEADDSKDDTTVKGKINNLKAADLTNQAIGMHWAWMTLQLDTTVPFPAPPKDANYKYTDVIILLSDGMNTQDRWYNKASQIDARQEMLCDNITDPKNGLTTIYTIQVNTGRDPTSGVLQTCAAKGGKFYLSTSSGEIASAFNQIGASLNKLRIAK
jgi:Flp pilus assembly protein TadG